MAVDPITSAGPAIAEALKKGNKIEAIKLLREASGLGLAEAKQLIDRHDAAKLKVETAARTVASHSASHSPVYKPRPGLSPGQVAPSTGGPLAAVVVAVIVAALGAFLLLR